MTTIYLVRHGEYENPEYLFPGRLLTGFPLTEKGREQVENLSGYFKDKVVVALYSSPVLRTRQTAEILSSKLKIPIQVDDRLLEVKTTLEGESMQMFDDAEGGVSYQPDLHERGAESVEEVSGRLSGFIEEKRKEHKGKTILAVTHGDPMRYAVMKYKDIPIDFRLHSAVLSPLAGGYQIQFDDMTGEATVASIAVPPR